MNTIHFTKQQVEAREYEALDPYLYDFRWNHDYTECTATRLTWANDSEYAEYQGDRDLVLCDSDGYEVPQKPDADEIAWDIEHGLRNQDGGCPF